MADRVEIFDIPVAAGTAKTAPVTVAMPFPDGIVTALELIIPDGPSGLSGIRLDYNSTPVIPNTPGAFIIGNDEKVEWPLRNFPTGGAWQATAYNTDLYLHTYQVRLLIDEFPSPEPAATVIVPIPSVSAAEAGVPEQGIPPETGAEESVGAPEEVSTP